MKEQSSADARIITRLHQAIGRSGFGGVVAGLAAGTLLLAMRHLVASADVLAATCGLLVVLPVANVLWVLAVEVRRRDWLFAGLAAAVLALVIWNVAERI